MFKFLLLILEMYAITNGVISPHILDLGTRRRWVAVFACRLLWSLGKSFQKLLNRRLGDSQFFCVWTLSRRDMSVASVGRGTIDGCRVFH